MIDSESKRGTRSPALRIWPLALYRYIIIWIQMNKKILTNSIEQRSRHGNIEPDAVAPIDVIIRRYAGQLVRNLFPPDFAPEEFKIWNLTIMKLLLMNLTPGFDSSAHVFVGFNDYEIVIVSVT